MFGRSVAFILFVLIGAGAGYAQTQEPKSEKQGAVKAFSWSFDSDGGYLGVQTEEVSKENLAKFGLREVKGVGIESVAEGSPAQAAGLQKGDVIVSVNGDAITSTRKLTRLIGEISPDHQVRLTVLRNGGERDVTVTVGKRPAPKFDNGAFGWSGPTGRLEGLSELPNLQNLPRFEMPNLPPGAPGAPMAWSFGGSRRQIGVSTTSLSKQLAQHYGVGGGVLVNEVRENSPAARAGIKAGDIIIEADGKQIGADFGLASVITEKRDAAITLTIVRDRGRQTVSVTPEEVKGSFNNFFEFSTPEAPGEPQTPGLFKMMRPAVPGVPATPSAPLPLNQLLIPGRVV